jgi:hypothetical protein
MMMMMMMMMRLLRTLIAAVRGGWNVQADTGTFYIANMIFFKNLYISSISKKAVDLAQWEDAKNGLFKRI